MAEKPKLEPDDKEQSQRFKQTARELEVDESGETFSRAMKTIVSSKPDEKALKNK